MRIHSVHIVAGLMMGLLVACSAMADQSRSQAPSGYSLMIGAERIGEPAVLYVGMVHPEGPAHKAGIRHGDEVTSVDGKPVTGKSYEEVVHMIRGEAGTTVKMQVKDEKGVHELSVERVAGDKLKRPAESHGKSEY